MKKIRAFSADAVLPHGINKALRYCGTKALRENAENMSFRGADARRIINGLTSFINVITLKRADAVLPHGTKKRNMSFRGADARQIIGSTVGIHFMSGKPITNNANEMDCYASLRSARNDMKYISN